MTTNTLNTLIYFVIETLMSKPDCYMYMYFSSFLTLENLDDLGILYSNWYGDIAVTQRLIVPRSIATISICRKVEKTYEFNKQMLKNTGGST